MEEGGFARAGSELAPPVVASKPTPGFGLALDDDGRIPTGAREIRTGTAAQRPTAATNIIGLFWYATDTAVLSYSDGSTWTAVTPGSAALGALQTYTPTWTQSTSNPTIGNGTVDGKYWQIGKQVRLVIGLFYGTTTTSGTGFFKFSLPVSATGSTFHGSGLAVDTGGSIYPVIPRYDGGSLHVYQATVPAIPITEGAPFAWANGDFLQFDIAYEAA